MNRNFALDGLKGVLALLVVFHHFCLAFYPSMVTGYPDQVHTANKLELFFHGTPLALLVNGTLDVVLFLLLSGYLVSMSILKPEVISIDKIQKSVTTRFFRFGSLLLVINLITYLIFKLGFMFNQQAADLSFSAGWLGTMHQNQPNLFTAINQSFYSLFTIFPLSESYNSSAWTMPFFFTGSLMIMSLAILIKSNQFKWLVIIVALLLTYKDFYWILMIGLMIYLLEPYFAQIYKFKSVKLISLIGFVYFGSYPQYYQTAVTTNWYRQLPIFQTLNTTMTYHAIAGILLFLTVINSHTLSKLFTLKIWQYFGTRSFSIYLCHVLIINSLMSWLFITLIKSYSYGVSVIASASLGFGVILILAELLYLFIESKSVNYIKSI